MFYDLTDALSEALFNPNKSIGSLFSVSLLDYWESLLEYLDPELSFDTSLHPKDNGAGWNVPGVQINTRSFLALNEGYDIDDYGSGEIVSRCPELSDRIISSLRDWGGEERYERLIEFIHRHKDEAPFESD